MKRIIHRLARGVLYLCRQLSCSSDERAFMDRFLKTRLRRSPVAQPLVAVQAVTDDLFFLGLFGEIAEALRVFRAVRLEAIATQSLNVAESSSWFAFAGLRLALNPLLVRKWLGLYRSFCDGVAYRSVSFSPVEDWSDWRRAGRCWRGLADRESLTRLEIDGIVVGDLVNDSYLRFKPAPTIDLRDPYLRIILWQMFRDLRRARRYFVRARPAIYLTSYTTYVQHGIPARVALKSGVRVFAFGNYQQFAKEVTQDDWTHTRAPERYAQEFAALPDPASKREIARRVLDARLSGVIDLATSYMRKSAYAESEEEVPDVRGCVVVFLHDFFDSPHVYHDMVFPDFWEWTCLTVQTLRAAGIPFVIKPHPNQIGENSRVLDELKLHLGGARFISSAITNKQLAKAGVVCAVTVYGTVAHEMAYLGIPSIACARHPHVSFGFCQTAKTRAEYIEMLHGAARIAFDCEWLKRQSLEFCFIHNMGMDDLQLQLRDATLDFRNACGDAETTSGNRDLPGKLCTLSNLEGFHCFVRDLTGALADREASAMQPQSGGNGLLHLTRESQ
jgi:hypothetical protein